jgi:hypothetical protein
MATYRAPSGKPTPNTVTVSATIPRGRKKQILASDITLKEQVSYVGTVQFESSDTFGSVSASANVTWTEFRNPRAIDNSSARTTPQV